MLPDNDNLRLAKKEMADWRRYAVGMPFGLILAIYIVLAFQEVRFPFLRTFGHGDLILLSALLLVGNSARLRQWQERFNELRNSERVGKNIASSLVLAFAFLVLYAGNKFGFAMRDYFADSDLPVKIIACIAINIATLVFTYAYTNATSEKAIRELMG